jgi:hypothetical protein
MNEFVKALVDYTKMFFKKQNRQIYVFFSLTYVQALSGFGSGFRRLHRWAQSRSWRSTTRESAKNRLRLRSLREASGNDKADKADKAELLAQVAQC